MGKAKTNRKRKAVKAAVCFLAATMLTATFVLQCFAVDLGGSAGVRAGTCR